ncbi:MAG: hypothetical protein ACRD3T_00840 [Terriglobia bacterium]
MAQESSSNSVSISKLILILAVITLAVTILRLFGELHDWSPLFFSRQAGGGLAIVGISWLPIFFGPYFGLKLRGANEECPGAGKTIAIGFVGFVVLLGGGVLAFAKPNAFPGAHIVGLLLLAAGGLLQFASWPGLAKVLLAYGYAARIPVVIVMFFAMRGSWGTHYDAVAPGYAGPTALWPKYLLLGIEPQMIMWIAYTMAVGSFFAGIVLAIAGRKKPAEVTA